LKRLADDVPPSPKPGQPWHSTSMGAAAALLVRRDPYALYVDDPKDIDPLLKGYSRSIFKKLEWPTFKMFCNQFGITHADTCVVFRKFLNYEEVYLLQFQVRTKDVKNHFSLHSKLEKEIAESLVPLMFMKEFPGLERPQPDGEVVSFARFIIMSYLFCTAQIPDLILDFVAMLRRKLSISTHTNLHAYTLEQLMKVMVEDLQPSAAGWILAQSLSQIQKEEEMPLLMIIKLGIKYPILFYIVERFRKHIKRLVFGDKFWAAHTYFKSRIGELDGNATYYGERYKDERTALIETSRSIIADVVTPHKRVKKYRPHERDVSAVMFLDEEGLRRLKDLFGYERSRQLVVDSEIGLDCESKFVENAFGAEEPVPRPPRGVQVFPGGRPLEILELTSDDEDDGHDGDAGDEEGQEADGAGSADAGSDHGHTSALAEIGAEHDGDRETDAPRSVGTPSEPGSPARSWFSWSPAHSRLALTTQPSSADMDHTASAEDHQHPGAHHGRVEVLLDAQQGREFRYDPATGKSAWVFSAVDPGGDVLLETCF
jgi:hypothetical protein